MTMNYNDIKILQKKIRAVADGIPGPETLDKIEKYYNSKKGYWIKEVWVAPLSDSTMNVYQCSKCGLHYQCESNFCPNCGADMRGGNSE